MNFKVTKFRMKVYAIIQTIIMAPRVIYVNLLLTFYQFYNAQLEAYMKNPNIKW